MVAADVSSHDAPTSKDRTSPALEAALSRILILEADLHERCSAELTRAQIAALLHDLRVEQGSAAKRFRGGGPRLSAAASGSLPMDAETADLRSSAMMRRSAADGLAWDASNYPSAKNSPRFAGAGGDSSALLRRVTELERENAVIDARRLQAEAEASKQQANYLDILRHIEAREHVDFLFDKTTVQNLPAEFRGLSREEVIPALVEAYDRHRCARVSLEAAIETLTATVEDQSERLAILEEELRMKDDLASAHEGFAEDFQTRIDVLTEQLERLLQENTLLQLAVGTQTAQLERALVQLKDREKSRLESLAELDGYRSAAAELQRDVEERKEKIRSLEAERDVLLRQLESSEKRVAEGERRLAELAQKDLQEGVDVARKNKRQWLEMIRAVRNAKVVHSNPGSGVPVTVLSSTGGPGGPTGQGQAGRNPTGAVTAATVPTRAAANPNASTSSALFGQSTIADLLSMSSSVLQSNATLSTSDHPIHAPLVVVPPPPTDQQAVVPYHASPADGAPASGSQSKQPSPDPAAGRGVASLPPGRLVKGAAPARPASRPVATIAAMSHPLRAPVSRQNHQNSNLLKQLLKTRFQRSTEEKVEAAVARTKRRTPAPPPMSLQDIAYLK